MPIYITPEADRYLNAYLSKAEGEISGFGQAQYQGGVLIIDEIFILTQESSAGHTELDTDAMQELLFKLVSEDKSPEDIWVWWHSHGNTGVFFSPTDTSTIERFRDFGKPWMVSLVGNRKLEKKVRLDYYEPIRSTVESLELQTMPIVDIEFEKAIQREIEEKVRKPIPAPTSLSTKFSHQYPWLPGHFLSEDDKKGESSNNNDDLEEMIRRVGGIPILDSSGAIVAMLTPDGGTEEVDTSPTFDLGSIILTQSEREEIEEGKRDYRKKGKKGKRGKQLTPLQRQVRSGKG